MNNIFLHLVDLKKILEPEGYIANIVKTHNPKKPDWYPTFVVTQGEELIYYAHTTQKSIKQIKKDLKELNIL